ncbi:histamine N-methyltransferase-like [Branchiostoma floridae]|uniref:Histamine N-methyltransferase-like n=1 Tax=Branchiostoma floridae TaxID=7739 RepID=A0A9J7M771_BRAFL|nr:histamine N-methyltransferase-like [Branchiostoma floridae]
MDLGKLIHASPERYSAGFAAIKAAIGKNNIVKDYLFYATKVPDSLLCESGAELRVLGIGSGSGEVDSLFLKKLLKRHSSVYNRVVEPSGEMVDRYKALVQEDASLGAVKFDWRQQTAEEYFQTKDDTKFHLIHAVNILYHVDPLHDTLRNMWEQLADGVCMLVVVMGSDKCDWMKLWYKLWEEFGQPGDRLMTSLRTSDDVTQWFDTQDIGYVTDLCENIVDVTECFEEGSETGAMLLDFLAQTPYVSSKPGIRAMVLEYIRRNSLVVDDKILFKSATEVIIAFKEGTEEM